MSSVPSASAYSSVAIVHDYLNQCGGAERVALELARTWPSAPVYTSLYRPDSTFQEFRHLDVRTSPLNRLPIDRQFRTLAPLYPAAFRALGILEHDVVISSSSGWAHGVRTAHGSLHVVYCHTPARWLYEHGDHLGRTLGSALLSPFRGALQAWDRRAAGRADLYVANCENVRQRILAVYGKDSVVVHPPVDVDRFTPSPRGERLLVVSRLLPYKRVDLIVRAAKRAGLALDVVGEGPSLPELKRIASPQVHFHGRLDDGSLTELMQEARTVCVAGAEDFGITPLEALAAGTPVVAFARGGVLETMEDGVSAVLFREQTVDAVVEAIERADGLSASPAELAALARGFSSAAFRQKVLSVISEALDAKGRGAPVLG